MKKKEVTSTCCYCGVGCGVKVQQDAHDLITVTGDEGHPVNRGKLCSKGMNLQYTVNDRSDRLHHPQMRYHRSMPMQRVSWDDALTRTAAVFRSLISTYGPDSVAFYASGQCLTEEYYVINKLVKGFIGSNNIDTNSRLCMSSAVAAYKLSLGEDSVPICYDDIELADCLLVEGGNPAWCHPILWRRVEAHKSRHPDTKIIVVDPRKTDSAAIADLHLQIQPGTDMVLNYALGRLLIENGDIDTGFIEQHTEGFTAYEARVFERTVAEAAWICRVPESEIRQAATYIGTSRTLLTLWTMGLNQSVKGVDKNLSLIDLNLITGRIGKPGSGPFSLTGQPNAMGGREVGGLANLLPAHRDLKNEVHRREVADFWGGTAISGMPGLTATEMFDALADGTLKAIWILSTNPLTSLPDARKIEQALKRAKFVVVQEISNKPQTLDFADVILPAAGWAEKEGTMTNSERRISRLHKIVDPPGEALPDAEIICRFAQKMGYAGFDYTNMEAIYREHARLTAKTSIQIDGLDYERIDRHRTIQWPYRKSRDAGTPRLFENHRFYTPTKKAIIHSPGTDMPSEQPDAAYPFILTTGRIRDQWHTMTKTGKVSKLTQHIKEPQLEIHQNDARRLGIEEGQLVAVTSRRGHVRVKATIGNTIKPGCVFLPMHWGKRWESDLNRANNLTNPLLDPISKEPDFKFCAVHVAPYKKTFERIVIVGAGAGAFGFVKAFRAINTVDDITVLSNEDLPFYNRVMLPHYVSGDQQWRELVKMQDAEEQDVYRINHIRGVTVTHIDRATKCVEDSRGVKTPYDVLILGTGSRPTMPKGIPTMPGIFSMRRRADADNLRKFLRKDASVVIIGGGLLGLEMAASLCEMGMKITVVQRVSRFLNRQLDALGSQMLHEEMVELGCDVYYNDEVQLYYGRNKVNKVELKSGRQIKCDAVIVAIGTTPNIELAKAAGLQCHRGVVVNNRLQTSAPSIYAIGEIAEFEGTRYGITAAAEQQGAVVARYHHGDVGSVYEGSVFMNIIKIQGFDLCSIGLVDCPDDSYEEIVFIDKAKRYYKKCIIHQDRLVGAILIGDKNEFLEFKDLITNKTELSEKRLQLLRSGSTKEPVIGKLVCSCNQVGEGNLNNLIQSGCTELDALCEASGAGSGCGSCRPQVAAILEACLAETEKMEVVNG
ncbi:molybdopterin-dependent oxidoreductase [Parapedobacter sp. 10938]|uniref:molybdopterin-dependent oxidoreductase n=1 Tax=Parapedobacter flavus TaxID=3110225 RepID=UPI002DBFC3B1|nr:molybdopterin-dependent oxidoreductase [Parapedobacter sp. 10938]MEC3878219.1 molybdopterin-dependent oxidoreductase [Parapedobacter sp. 10938]